MKSNEALLSMRQNIISEFKKYEYIILPFMKFILIFSAIHMLITATNYTGALSGVIAVMFLALIGTFVSAQWILIGSILLTTLFILPANPIFAILMFILLTILYLAFMRLFPKEGLLTLVTLMAFAINVPLILPIIVALLGGYICIVMMIIGVIVWFMVPELTVVIQTTTLNKSEIVDLATSVSKTDFNALLMDEKMLSVVVVFFIVFSVVYIIRKQSIDYAPYIAIGVGMVVNILGFGLAILFFDDIGMKMGSIILWTVIGGIVAVVVQFFSVALDYQRSEVVQFEDDDNYYYVKVVPKINVKVKHTTVKHVYTNNKGPKDFNSRIMESYNEDKGI
ncbi:hypothetical protein [Cellulosilyticum sp. WCF-2]|uniref:hypothetical protein n=1 Tax=Cellulosilyticum sp. WCF-2 TaxID=2497860 RepID=UPI000F8CE54A|nr:hypothetical protein [Cellulosilyticum sp. WCF-2]QEH70560.1 hypothetical protein EKH84_20085 [Cellulosilyticum sp. WCF-2]